ncbi:hypothetical protein [Sabulicella glaciei]|uniref:Uncharacterized protein n=1 Tax=Sabulicella glaciei TaxID=2984948 RepID=A0ABT3NQT2_9PROT|nr:hypothetical protein [Roseococcus sp. MDT2-1-1]MCW8084515.1 hypothetical protein [Roseococcus sp. MDT2-1-1]
MGTLASVSRSIAGLLPPDNWMRTMSASTGMERSAVAELSQAWTLLQEVEGRTWAAWVQAIGSVLAILVAARIASRQTRMAMRREHAEQRDVRRGVAFLANNLAKLLLVAHETLSDPKGGHRLGWSSIPAIENILSVLRSVDFKATRDAQLMLEVQTVIQCGLTAIEIARSVSEREAESEFRPSEIDGIRDIVDLLGKVVSEIDRRGPQPA